MISKICFIAVPVGIILSLIGLGAIGVSIAVLGLILGVILVHIGL